MATDWSNSLRALVRIFLFSNYRGVGRIILVLGYSIAVISLLALLTCQPEIERNARSVEYHEPYWVCPVQLQPLPNQNKGIAPDEYPSYGGIQWSKETDSFGRIEFGLGNGTSKFMGINLVEKKIVPVSSGYFPSEQKPWGDISPFHIELLGNFRTIKKRILAGYPFPTKIKTQSFECFTGSIIIQDLRVSGPVPLVSLKYKNVPMSRSGVGLEVSPKGQFLLMCSTVDPKRPVFYFFRHEEGR